MNADVFNLNVPQQFQLAPLVRGDTWQGIDPLVISINGATPLVPAASARLQFRKAFHPSVTGEALSTADGTIEIVSAALWSFRVPPKVLAMNAGRWVWDLQVTDTAGTIVTPVGGSLTIVQDQTQ